VVAWGSGSDVDSLIGEDLFDIREAARVVRVSVSSLQHLAAGRRIGFLRLGRRAYFTRGDLERYLWSRRVEAVADVLGKAADVDPCVPPSPR
jgi:excisionase family DNA binding protein